MAHFRVHDLRLTVATGMASLGVNPHTISLVLDHISAIKGTVTTAVYVKYALDREKREALEMWERHLTGIVKVVDLTAFDDGKGNHHSEYSKSGAVIDAIGNGLRGKPLGAQPQVGVVTTETKAGESLLKVPAALIPPAAAAE